MHGVARGSCRKQISPKHVCCRPPSKKAGRTLWRTEKEGSPVVACLEKSGKSGSQKDEAGRAAIRSLRGELDRLRTAHVVERPLKQDLSGRRFPSDACGRSDFAFAAGRPSMRQRSTRVIGSWDRPSVPGRSRLRLDSTVRSC